MLGLNGLSVPVHGTSHARASPLAITRLHLQLASVSVLRGRLHTGRKGGTQEQQIRAGAGDMLECWRHGAAAAGSGCAAGLLVHRHCGAVCGV